MIDVDAILEKRNPMIETGTVYDIHGVESYVVGFRVDKYLVWNSQNNNILNRSAEVLSGFPIVGQRDATRAIVEMYISTIWGGLDDTFTVIDGRLNEMVHCPRYGRLWSWLLRYESTGHRVGMWRTISDMKGQMYQNGEIVPHCCFLVPAEDSGFLQGSFVPLTDQHAHTLAILANRSMAYCYDGEFYF